MQDLISRQAVIDRINKLIEVEKKQGTDDWGYGRERVNAYEAMLHFVKSEYLYPSVEPERKPGKWIPVSERLPEKDGRYQVTRYDYVANTEFIDILWYEENQWWNRHSTGNYAVTAWMPLPESFKG